MKVLLTGGGTGGHITPLLAVAHELKARNPECKIYYIGEKNAKFGELLTGNSDIDHIHKIFAGKYRRYNGESLFRKITDIKSIFLNTRDFFYFLIGLIESLILVKKINPDVIFLKGGFVGVPVGLSGAIWRKKMITHDSDDIPGLANRIISKWVFVHAVANSPDNYNYPKGKISQVGVIVGSQYKFVDEKTKFKYRDDLQIPKKAKLLMITGGSLGSEKINSCFKEIVPILLADHSDLYVIHQVGKKNEGLYREYKNDRLQEMPLLKNMHIYSGAADLIVSRAGANTISEFGVQGKSCIVIPNPMLAGGHQILNAQYLSKNDAALIIDEKLLLTEQGREEIKGKIDELLYQDNGTLSKFSNNLNKLTAKNAVQKIADIIEGINE